MMDKQEQLTYEWLYADSNKVDVQSEYYCQTRDVFEARNNRTPDRLIENGMNDGLAYLIYSMLGELGNNSFDHNLANWPDVPGVFFAVSYNGKIGKAIIADRGLGVLNTLKKAVPDLGTDGEALELAFTKKVSSRVMENRGNGLKFVKNNVNEHNLLLEFNSGNAQIIINHGMNKNNLENKINGCLAILNF